MSQMLKEASAVASAFREALDCCVALSGVQVGEHSPWAQQVPFQGLKTGPSHVFQPVWPSASWLSSLFCWALMSFRWLTTFHVHSDPHVPPLAWPVGFLELWTRVLACSYGKRSKWGHGVNYSGMHLTLSSKGIYFPFLFSRGSISKQCSGGKGRLTNHSIMKREIPGSPKFKG